MFQICASILGKGPVQPTATPDSPNSSELDNFARSIVSSMRRIPEERWNDVKTDIMLVVRKYSTPAHPAPSQSMGYRPPALAALGPSYDPNRSPGYNYPNALGRASPGHGYYRPPAATTTSPSQYLQQPSPQWPPFLPQLSPSPQQGLQYTQLGVATSTISTTTTTTTTTTAADTSVNDDFLGFMANN